MKLSFVIPAYNEETLIGKCLESITRELKESGHTAEIIVVDNNSTDDTAKIARSFPEVTVISEPRKGIVWARRAGYLASTGSLIANIDADTTMPSGWVNKVFTEFEKDSTLCALSGPQVYKDGNFLIRTMTKIFYIFGYAADRINGYLFNKSSMFQGGNYIVRRDVMEKIGGFDTSIEFYGEDVDTGRRIAAIGKVKWTFDLPMYSSARRFEKEGLATMGFKYGINYLWIAFKGKPFSKEHIDIRTK